jgi:hypothetical protein
MTSRAGASLRAFNACTFRRYLTGGGHNIYLRWMPRGVATTAENEARIIARLVATPLGLLRRRICSHRASEALGSRRPSLFRRKPLISLRRPPNPSVPLREPLRRKAKTFLARDARNLMSPDAAAFW